VIPGDSRCGCVRPPGRGVANSYDTKISIYTQIFPRLETFFLEEWIEHHIKLGVDKIYLYDHGYVSTDSVNGVHWWPHSDESTDVRWRKKPEADYFLDYTDTDISHMTFARLHRRALRVPA
jgi:hypothetical protein